MILRLLYSWFFSLGSAYFFWDALTGPQVLPGCLAFHLRQDPACLQHLLLSNQHSSTQCSLYKPLSSVDQLEVSPCLLFPGSSKVPTNDRWLDGEATANNKSIWTRKKKTTGAPSDLQETRRSKWRNGGEEGNERIQNQEFWTTKKDSKCSNYPS